MEFENFLDYIYIKTKEGKLMPINKEEILKRYEQFRIIKETQRTRTTRKRKTRKVE
jgi:hypothetical protein